MKTKLLLFLGFIFGLASCNRFGLEKLTCNYSGNQNVYAMSNDTLEIALSDCANGETYAPMTLVLRGLPEGITYTTSGTDLQKANEDVISRLILTNVKQGIYPIKMLARGKNGAFQEFFVTLNVKDYQLTNLLHLSFVHDTAKQNGGSSISYYSSYSTTLAIDTPPVGHARFNTLMHPNGMVYGNLVQMVIDPLTGKVMIPEYDQFGIKYQGSGWVHMNLEGTSKPAIEVWYTFTENGSDYTGHLMIR